MRQIQASEAKARFLQLLKDVERGDSVTITRHGRRIARLIPEQDRRQAEIDQAIEELRVLGRRNGPMTAKEILSARDEGRKR
jgi:prevent-host-death family protein